MWHRFCWKCWLISLAQNFMHFMLVRNCSFTAWRSKLNFSDLQKQLFQGIFQDFNATMHYEQMKQKWNKIVCTTFHFSNLFGKDILHVFFIICHHCHKYRMVCALQTPRPWFETTMVVDFHLNVNGNVMKTPWKHIYYYI